MACYAFMRGGRIYTIMPLPKDPITGRKPFFKYRGYMDGVPCGAFRSKKEFEAFVESEPNEFLDTKQEHVRASLEAQCKSENEGRWILKRLKERNGKSTKG